MFSTEKIFNTGKWEIILENILEYTGKWALRFSGHPETGRHPCFITYQDLVQYFFCVITMEFIYDELLKKLELQHYWSWYSILWSPFHERALCSDICSLFELGNVHNWRQPIFQILWPPPPPPCQLFNRGFAYFN